MKLHIYIKILTIISVTGLYSCSQKSTISTRPDLQTGHILSGLDTLLIVPEIDLSFFEPKTVEFFTPALEITETFNNFEKSAVRVKDSKLFSKNKDLIVDLTQIGDGKFAFPLPGAKVISNYGIRGSRRHTGVDLKTKANDTIVAAFDGIVRVSNRGRGYGNVIVIRHYNGLETVYSHNSKNIVKSGERVTAGTPIALTGRTGRASTEHLHFEVRINGEHFNPDIVIDLDSGILRNKCMVFTPGSKGNILINQI